MAVKHLRLFFLLFLLAMSVVLKKTVGASSSASTVFYLPQNDTAKILSLDLGSASSLFVHFYNLYHPKHNNIPRTPIKELMASLELQTYLDPHAFRPYKECFYYWSWKKRPEERQALIDFLKKGFSSPYFKKDWEICVVISRLYAEMGEQEKAKYYLEEALKRTIRFGGPRFLLDWKVNHLLRNGGAELTKKWIEEILPRLKSDKLKKVLIQHLKELEDNS
jgi:hypothetical protein